MGNIMDKNMSKYRFKTKEEFIMEGFWDEEFQTPSKWNDEGEMNHYMGKDVPIEFDQQCDKSGYIEVDGWIFSPHDYVLKELYYDSKDGVMEYVGDVLMNVSQDGEKWFRRVVFGKKNGKYISWDVEADTLEDAKDCTRTNYWEYAKPIEIVKLTKKEIAEKFGLDVKDIEIID